ncbi:hypothetical protein GCM10011611_30300 [Aliidongia dinghuensis]|uniref:Uncharacterized protein n=1 Tax=Aliidongia dinghuensis TaxID=1867774 RepID=A0A8J3E2K8_9PROT|nr:hypothetical protein [Aliidongia dinghuensis]GGF22173.1 hypothetical protein GCM10011611_30300 [Aliidongia dinghuensis]
MTRPTKLSMFMGLVLWLSYARAQNAWENPVLVGVALFVALALPSISVVSNILDARVSTLAHHRLPGRLARFVAQLLVNIAIFAVMIVGRVIPPGGIDQVGGIAGAAAVTTLASQGLQAVALWLAWRGIGRADGNVLLALSANIVVAALAIAGIGWARQAFLIGGAGLAVLAVLTDLRAGWPRRAAPAATPVRDEAPEKAADSAP